MVSTSGRKSDGRMMLIVTFLLLTLVGAGTGFAVGSLLNSRFAGEADQLDVADGGSSAEQGVDTIHGNSSAKQESTAIEKDKEDTEGAAETTEDGEDVDVRIVPLPPVLTTLAAPPGTWIRLEGSALVQRETEDSPEHLADKAGEHILSYLRTVRLDQIEGPSGTLGLRRDLTEMVRALSDGQVRGILIYGLLVE